MQEENKTPRTDATQEKVEEAQTQSENTEAQNASKEAEKMQGTEEAAKPNEMTTEDIVGDPLDDNALEEIKGMKKHDAANLIVSKTRHIVEDTDKQLDACKVLLSDDLKAYEEAKAALMQNALAEAEALLRDVGYLPPSLEEGEDEEVVVFEPKEEIAPFYVKEPSSGKFGGFVLGVVAAAATLGGVVYAAAQKAGVALALDKVPDFETCREVFSAVPQLWGGEPNMTLGAVVAGGAAVAAGWIVYAIKVAMKGSSNLSFAKKQLEEAREYAKHKGDCKAEMDKVDAHMNEAIETLKGYEVALREQNGKLHRIIHIEGKLDSPDAYHEKSKREIEETHKLVETIKRFVSTPMSEAGRLSQKSVALLKEAKANFQAFIDKLY